MDLCKLHCIQVTCINTINGNETPLWMVKTAKYLKNACDYISLLSHKSLKFQYIMRYDIICWFTILVFW